MKAHDYEISCEQHGYEDGIGYALAFSTDDYMCYQEVKDAMINIVMKYESSEAHIKNQ